MRVLVTGAAGMLGRDLIPALTALGHEVTGVDMDVDITNPAAVDACVDRVRPQAVFHLAAWTNVDGAEEHEPASLAVNGDGTRNVARAAARAGAALVAVSTDYVFRGDNAAGYREDDPTGPIGAYGRTKLAGEQAALHEHPSGARIARTAWLYGAHGRNFVDTMRRLGAERDELTVVADQTGSPTWTRDLAPALIALLDQPPGIYHVAGGGSVTWADFARAIFDECGLDCTVRDVTTAEYGAAAPRPAWSILTVTKVGAPRLRDWRAALHEYIETTSTTVDTEGH
ncbi:MAG TPA: dTDP-4-dehydrorhamnose reductase [Miltoncostaeales bacterium]|nr:dTDP-4-dehydrorhamnose reductase [Miltoncostaeales bacterium]